MNAPEYDEATCITATELRAQGIPLPPEVPGPAWIRRSAIVFAPGAAKRDPNVPGRISCGIAVTFTEPFHYVDVTIEVVRDDAPPSIT